MMGKPIQQKKFSVVVTALSSLHRLVKTTFHRNSIFWRGYSLAFIFATSNQILAKDVPFLYYTGLTPWMVEGEAFLSDKDLQTLNTCLSDSIDQSGRFYAYPTALIKSFWRDEEKKKEQINSLEIETFLEPILSLSPSGRLVTAIQILDVKQHQTLVQEDLSWDVQIFKALSAEEKCSVYRQIYHMLVNRLPLDVYVTSQTGSFLTLSGGLKQGLTKGDMVTIVRPSSKTLELATGYWSQWDYDLLGSARIISVSDASSVAELTVLSQSEAIKPRVDGVVLSKSPSRLFFLR